MNHHLFLTCKFFNSEISSNETMEQHVNKSNTMVEELEVIGTTMLLEVKVTVFLMNFPINYQPLVTSSESY
jgi:hypothetical protein